MTEVNNNVQSQWLTPINASEKVKQEDALRKACSNFEGMFLEMMMRTMRTASDSMATDNSFIKKNNGEKIFTEMLDQQYVDLASANNASGLGEMLFNNLKSTLPQYKQSGNNFPSDKEINDLDQLRDKSINMKEALTRYKMY